MSLGCCSAETEDTCSCLGQPGSERPGKPLERERIANIVLTPLTHKYCMVTRQSTVSFKSDHSDMNESRTVGICEGHRGEQSKCQLHVELWWFPVHDIAFLYTIRQKSSAVHWKESITMAFTTEIEASQRRHLRKDACQRLIASLHSVTIGKGAANEPQRRK